MSLVYAGILSHAPGITGRAHLAPDKTMRDEFYAYLTKQRRDIESSGAGQWEIPPVPTNAIFSDCSSQARRKASPNCHTLASGVKGGP